jgi:hypothetical protein
MNFRSVIFSTALVLSGSIVQASAAIVDYANRNSFELATGATTVEDFGNAQRNPISTGVLNSSTNLPAIGITPGLIKPGVTYSTPVGGYFFSFFNIDTTPQIDPRFGETFDGGFLDGFTRGGVLTIQFDAPQKGFGFDTDLIMGAFEITIKTSAGSFSQSFANTSTHPIFFGFGSSQADILSATIAGSGFAAFAVDNFTYDANAVAPAVPEPSTWAMMMLGFAGMGFMTYRKMKSQGAQLEA